MPTAGTARSALERARETGQSLEAVRNGAKPDLFDAVLAPVLGDTRPQDRACQSAFARERLTNEQGDAKWHESS